MNKLSNHPRVVDLNNWRIFSSKIASPSEPEEYCEAAVDRLMLNIEDYVSHVKNVRPQFKPTNSIKLIEFLNDKQRTEYALAVEEYRALLAKLEGMPSAQRQIAKITADLKYRQKAELLKAENHADEMYYVVEREKHAAVCACNFQATIATSIKFLVEKYKVPRDKITIIWGGDKRFDMAHCEPIPDDVIIRTLTNQAMGIAVDKRLLKRIKLQLEARVLNLDKLSPDLKLGKQSKKERQREIDKFQSGYALYNFFTFKSGGIGLSLHHTDEFTKEKVRRKPNGFAYIEDIPKIPTRQRDTILATTWSPMEMVQGLGRVPRLTSLSPTRQVILGFKGTIEIAVLIRNSMGLKCLKKVVRSRESWEDAIWENMNRDPDELERELLEDGNVEEDEENTDILMGDYTDEIDGEDEEENGEEED
jgi:hypothetical protein